MSANPLSAFLNTDKQIKLPEGGEFSPSGFIGKVFAQHAFTFMTEENPADHAELPPFLSRRKQGEWYVVYYATQASAKVAMEMLGVQGYEGKDPTANEVWSIMVDRDTVMNFADPEKLAKWSNPIVSDIRITTLQSKKYRHELHMLALPCAVQAMAKLYGYEYEPFSVNELLRKPEDMHYTDEFFAEMCGNPDSKVGTDKVVPADYYTNSTLYQRRAALWNSLGEKDASKYQPIGGGKFATTSEKLSNCLQVVTAEWSASMYGRVVNVPDPRVDATYESKTSGETKRNNLPVLFELFPSEAEAMRVAREEMARILLAKGQSNGNGHVATSSIPAKWLENEVGDKWAAFAQDLKSKYATVPSIPVLNKLARESDATVDELKQVWN